jgi:hypothetical protein
MTSFERVGTPQVVILDHGLYREMTDATRLAYSDFMVSLVLHRDREAQVCVAPTSMRFRPLL